MAGERAAPIRKAVIPVAGLGTRLLPATKSQPKEMLPVGRKPAVQYVVEEMVEAGITQILLITGRQKSSIEDHFDRETELERRLVRTGAYDLAEELNFFEEDVALFYTRQSVQSGPADAIRLAADFVGDEPFLVAYGDTIITSQQRPSLIQRMLEDHLHNGACATLAVETVRREEVQRYGIVQPTAGTPPQPTAAFEIDDLIEKPEVATAPSTLAITPRYIFDRSIFDAINRTLPGRGGELWLTDSIAILLRQGGGVRCLPLGAGEKRYDIGNFETYFKAFIDFALADERYGYLIRQYLVGLSEQL